MIQGIWPLFLFKFENIALPIPVPMIDDIFGVVEKSVDMNMTIATEYVAGKLAQRGVSNSLTIEFSATRTSMFSMIVLPLLKRALSVSNTSDLTFGLIKNGVEFDKSYTVSYFSGNQFIVDGVITGFDYSNEPNSELVNVSITISEPPPKPPQGGAGGLTNTTTNLFGVVGAGITKAVGVAPW